MEIASAGTRLQIVAVSHLPECVTQRAVNRAHDALLSRQVESVRPGYKEIDAVQLVSGD